MTMRSRKKPVEIETVQSDTNGDHPRTQMTKIRGRCPSCLAQSLTLARDGIVACSAPGCRDRGAANYLLNGGDMALVSLLGGDARARMMAESLAVDGITYSKLASVTDAELDRTPGINSTAIARIREVFPAPGAPCYRPAEGGAACPSPLLDSGQGAPPSAVSRD